MRRKKWALSAPPSSGSGFRMMAEHLLIILTALCTSCEAVFSALSFPGHLSACVSLQTVCAPTRDATAVRVCRAMDLAWAQT